MNNACLQHHGIKGMRWGIRRFQRKDGNLTPLGRKRNKGSTETEKEETIEERKARVLKSSDPKEIYANKDILTNNELNERVNRLELEAKLSSKIPQETKKTAMQQVDDVLKMYKKADEVYSTVANSTIGKTLYKKLGLELEKKEFSFDEVWNKRNKLSTKDLQDAASRAESENKIRTAIEREKNREKNSNAKTQESGNKTEESKDTNKTEGTKTHTGTVKGEGTSKYSGGKDGPTVDVKEGKNYWSTNDDLKNSNVSSATPYVPSGEAFVSGFLEDKRGG